MIVLTEKKKQQLWFTTLTLRWMMEHVGAIMWWPVGRIHLLHGVGRRLNHHPMMLGLGFVPHISTEGVRSAHPWVHYEDTHTVSGRKSAPSPWIQSRNISFCEFTFEVFVLLNYHSNVGVSVFLLQMTLILGPSVSPYFTCRHFFQKSVFGPHNRKHLKRYEQSLYKSWRTVEILKIRTPEKFAVITLKFEQGGLTIG